MTIAIAQTGLTPSGCYGGRIEAGGAGTPPVSPLPNIAVNSKFENGGAAWATAYSPSGTISYSSSDFGAGHYKARFQSTSGSPKPQTALEQVIAVTAGELISVSAYCRTITAIGIGGQLVLNAVPSSGWEQIGETDTRPRLDDLVVDARFSWTFRATVTGTLKIRFGLLDGDGDVEIDRPKIERGLLTDYVATGDPGGTPPDPGTLDLDFLPYNGLYDGAGIDFAGTNINTLRLDSTGYRGWRVTVRRTGTLVAMQHQLASNKSGETSKSSIGGNRSHGYPAEWDVGLRVFNADSGWQISGAALRQFEWTYKNPDGVGGSNPATNNTRVVFEHDLANLAVTAGQRLLFLVYSREGNPSADHPSVNMASNYGRPDFGLSPPRAASLYYGDDPMFVSSSSPGGTLAPISQRIHGIGLRYSDGAEFGTLANDCTPGSYSDGAATSNAHVGFIYGSRRIRQRWSSPYWRKASKFALACYHFPGRTPADDLTVKITGSDISTATIDLSTAQVQQFDFSTSGPWTRAFTHQLFDLPEPLVLSPSTVYTVELYAPGASKTNRYQTHFLRQFKNGLSNANNTSPAPSGSITVIEPNRPSGLAEVSSNGGSSWSYAGYGGGDTDMLFALFTDGNVSDTSGGLS